MTSLLSEIFNSLPSAHPTKDTKQFVQIADCVLGDRCEDEDGKRLRHPLTTVTNCVVKAILATQIEKKESFLTTYNPRGPLVKARLPDVLEIGGYSITNRSLRGYLEDEYSYTCSDKVFTVEEFERKREVIEEIWGGPVLIHRMPDNPCGVTVRPGPKPPAPVQIPARIPLTQTFRNAVVLGTDVFTGEVMVQLVRDLPHMLIAGTSGFGKSVFLVAFVTQLLKADPAEVAELLLVDLKGGIEFHGFARKSSRVRVVWEFGDVVEAVESLISLMLQRQREMVAGSLRLYPGKRVFFIVDEFAQIQLYPSETKEEKARHARLIANLNRLSMLGRAVGIVLIAAIQKPTTDVMDSSFRMNLQGQVCFKLPNRLMASTMFGSVDELKLDPMTLPRGRFIYFDPIAGTTRYLQSHIAAD